MEYTEIIKLKELLDQENIAYQYQCSNLSAPSEHHHILIYNRNDVLVSIIQGPWTHGGKNNLLEIMGLLTEEELKYDTVVGYLTAEQVFARILDYYKNNGRPNMCIGTNCSHFVYQLDRNGELAIGICTQMTGELDYEGNYRQSPCPLGLDEANLSEELN